MNKAAIYQKSARGTEAISLRLHGLGPKQRSLLIMIDGKRSFDELARLSAMLGDTEQLMAELEVGGFIETVAGAVAPAPAVAGNPPSTTTVTGSAPSTPLPEAKRLAVRLLTDIMGPMAEDSCLRIEAARNAAEFAAATAKAETLLRQAIGTAAANRFAAEIAAHQPAA